MTVETLLQECHVPETDTDRILAAIDASHVALDKKVTKKFEHLDSQMSELSRRLTFLEAEHSARADTALQIEKRFTHERHDAKDVLNAAMNRVAVEMQEVKRAHERVVTRMWGLLVGVILAAFAAALAWLKKGGQ